MNVSRKVLLARTEKPANYPPTNAAVERETLFVAEDVKSQDEIDEAVGATQVKKEELQLAEQLISGLLGTFDPEEELKSEYRTSLRELLEAKLEGREIAEPAPAEAE